MPDKAAAAAAKEEGTQLFKQTKFTEAEVKYSEAIAADETDHIHWSNRSACRLQLVRNADALRDAEKCVELAPGWAKGWRRKAAAEVQLGKTSDAELSIAAGLKVAPHDTELRMQLQRLRDGDGHTRGHTTLPATDCAVKDEVAAREAKARGNEFVQKNQFKDAAQQYTLALAYDAADAVFYSNRCACWENLLRWREALRDAETCIALRGDWAKAHSRKAAALVGLERWEDAQAAAKEGLKLDPDSVQLRRALAMAVDGAAQAADDAADDEEDEESSDVPSEADLDDAGSRGAADGDAVELENTVGCAKYHDNLKRAYARTRTNEQLLQASMMANQQVEQMKQENALQEKLQADEEARAAIRGDAAAPAPPAHTLQVKKKRRTGPVGEAAGSSRAAAFDPAALDPAGEPAP